MPSNSYNSVFGGANVNPAQLSYVSYTLAADLTLVWPFEAAEGASVAADKIDVLASTTGLNLILPDATQVSVGQDVLINNVGANPFVVRDNLGNSLATISSGVVWYLYLTDNSTTEGTWDVVQFAAGTSAANAASLAGAGLRALVTRLDQNLPTTALLANYSVMSSDRATVLQNNNGSVVWTFDSAVTLGNGWFAYAVNAGSGTVVLTPAGGQTIDGSGTKTLAPGESCAVYSDGTNLHSWGYGRSLVTTVSGTSIDASGSGDLVLSATQVAAQIQDFSGVLTGNRTITYGSGVGYWFVQNNTSGAFTMTYRVNNIDPGVVVPQGSYAVLRSDGTSMVVALTTTTGTVTEVDTGTGLQGGPITTTGTISISATAVAPGTYGTGPTETVAFTVNAQGQITDAAAGLIAIPISQINVFASADIEARCSDPVGTGPMVFAIAPAFANPTMNTQTAGDNSLLGANTSFVTTAVANGLATVAGFTTGDIKFTQATTVAAGWTTLDGGTIGNAASGATNRANADTAALFAFYWNDYSNALCPVSGGRGANAAADFAANKTITILDGRGRFFAAADAGAGRLGGGPIGGITGAATPGATGGEQGHQLIVGEMPSHTHPNGFVNAADAQSVGGPVLGGTIGAPTGSTGGDGTHNTTPPTLVVNVWVKL